MNFLVGDRVKYIGETAINVPKFPNEKEDLTFGILGTVVEVRNHHYYDLRVRFDAHKENLAWLVNSAEINKI